MQQIRIRSIEARHIARILEIQEEARLSSWSAEGYIEELRLPNAIMLRAEAESGEIVGFIVGRIVPASADTVEIDAEIYNIGVATAARRSGIGTELLKAFLSACGQAGVSNVWLEVRASNGPAIGFYQDNGFIISGERTNFYADPTENALLMRLGLSRPYSA